jgi:hypothetical protein
LITQLIGRLFQNTIKKGRTCSLLEAKQVLHHFPEADSGQNKDNNQEQALIITIVNQQDLGMDAFSTLLPHQSKSYVPLSHPWDHTLFKHVHLW